MFHNYYVYILKCKDDSFYVGVTNNMDRRLMEHDTGLNTRCYTYSKRPVALMYVEHTTSIHAAIAREKQIKGWSRKKKNALIEDNISKLEEYSGCINNTCSKKWY